MPDTLLYIVCGNWSHCCILCVGTVHVALRVAISPVYFGGRLGGCLFIKSVLHFIVVVL